MVEVLKGQCLCGKVEFEIKGDVGAFYFCHCLQCRKTTGSAFASNLFVKPEALSWIKGEDNLTRFEDPARDFFKRFCKTCGSGVPHLNRDKTKLTVPVGSLDNQPAKTPQANIFTAETPPWLEPGLAAHRFKGFPS